MRIMIADDHDLVRKTVRALIESTKIHEVCGEAVSVDDAISKAMQLKPDIIIMDLRLPEANGFQATREILKLLPQTAVVMFSQHSARQFVSEAFRAGACGYVIKDSATTDLLACIENLAQKKIFVSPSIGLREGSEPTAPLF